MKRTTSKPARWRVGIVMGFVVFALVVDATHATPLDLEPVRQAIAAGDADRAIQLLGDNPMKIPNGKGEPQFLYGKALEMNEQWGQAKDAYEEARKKRFGEQELLINLSRVYAKLEKYDDAVKLLEKEIKNEKDELKSARLKDALGMVYLSKGEYGQAQTQFMSAEIDDEKNLDYTLHLGDAYFRAQVYPLAITQYERVLRLDSSRTDVLFRIGKAYWEKKDFNRAYSAFSTLLTRDPSFDEAYFYLANINMLMAQSAGAGDARKYYLAALAAYQKVRELDNGANPVLVAKNIALVYYYMNDFESSVVELKNAIETGADDPELWFYLGRSLQLLERYDEAVEAFGKYEQARDAQDPPYTWTATDSELYRRRADCRKKLEDETQSDAILSDYMRAVELDSTDQYSRSSLAYALYTAERYEESIPHFRYLADHNPNDGRAVFNVSLPYMKMEAEDSAIVWLARAFDADTTAEGKYRMRAAVLIYPRLIKAERIADARKYLKYALDHEPENCEHHEWYAFTFYAQRQYSSARPLLEGAMACYEGKKKKCSYNELRFQLAYANLELADTTRAYKLLDEVLGCDPKHQDALKLQRAIDAKTEM